MVLRRISLPLILLSMAAIGCSTTLRFGRDAKTITPSDVMIAEPREVGSFTGIDLRTFGKVLLTQGGGESLVIRGSDNLVPLVKTTVRNDLLIIEMEESIDVLHADLEDLLTFTITVQDLTDLTVSGLAQVEMEALSTSGLAVTMSGAGQVLLGQLEAEQVDITVSGFGSVEIAGQVAHANVTISGAGNVHAPDLKCQTVDITIPGLGSATVWVTERLSGKISGGGNVSYYGDPITDTETGGLGSFKALGSK